MDGLNPAPPKEPWNGLIPCKYQQTVVSHGFLGGAGFRPSTIQLAESLDGTCDEFPIGAERGPRAPADLRDRLDNRPKVHLMSRLVFGDPEG